MFHHEKIQMAENSATCLSSNIVHLEFITRSSLVNIGWLFKDSVLMFEVLYKIASKFMRGQLSLCNDDLPQEH